jgi:WD40 repeat protein
LLLATANWTLRAAFGVNGGDVIAMAIAPDGTWLATGSRDGTVRIWDVTRRSQKAMPAVADRKVFAVAVAPDGTWLVSGDSRGTVRILDTTTMARKAAFRHDRYSPPGPSGL